MFLDFHLPLHTCPVPSAPTHSMNSRSSYFSTVLKVEGDSGAVVSVDKIDIHKSST